MRSRRRKLSGTVVVSVAVVGLMATACSSKKHSSGGATASASNSSSAVWNSTLSAANNEGQVTVWTFIQGNTNTALAAAFQKAYPQIKVNISTLTATAMTQKVDAEFGSHQSTVDVLIQGDRVWHASHVAAGYFKPIIGPDAVALDAKLRSGAAPSTDGKTTSAQSLYENNTIGLMDLQGLGNAWNKDAVKTQPMANQHW